MQEDGNHRVSSFELFIIIINESIWQLHNDLRVNTRVKSCNLSVLVRRKKGARFYKYFDILYDPLGKRVFIEVMLRN